MHQLDVGLALLQPPGDLPPRAAALAFFDLADAEVRGVLPAPDLARAVRRVKSGLSDAEVDAVVQLISLGEGSTDSMVTRQGFASFVVRESQSQ